MRKLDLITEQRFSHTARVAELNSALLEQAEVRAALQQTGRQLQDSLRKRAAMAEEIEKALRAIGHGLEINIGVAGLSLWLRKRDRAIEAHDAAWLMAVVLASAASVTLGLVVSDVAHGALDPRVRELLTRRSRLEGSLRA